MRWIFLLCAWFGTESGTTPASDLPKIEELNDCVQLRFQTLRTAPRTGTSEINPFGLSGTVFSVDARAAEVPALGMSRMATPPSFGEHFVPNVSAVRDFEQENEREMKVIGRLEADSVQVGFYLFGRAITKAGADPCESVRCLPQNDRQRKRSRG